VKEKENKPGQRGVTLVKVKEKTMKVQGGGKDEGFTGRKESRGSRRDPGK